MRVYQDGAVSVSIELDVMDCATCGVVFGVAQELVVRRRDDGQPFYCPNGHVNCFGASAREMAEREAAKQKARAERLAKRLQFAENEAIEERTRRETTEQSRNAIEGVVTKVRKRAQAGVCPVPACHRSFGPESALARHLATKHPDWTPEADDSAEASQ